MNMYVHACFGCFGLCCGFGYTYICMYVCMYLYTHMYVCMHVFWSNIRVMQMPVLSPMGYFASTYAYKHVWMHL
jgi:hypothetical protein